MEKKRLTDICRPKQWKTIPGKELKAEGYPVYGANGVIGYWDEYNHENETLTIACRGTCGMVNIAKAKSYINGNAMCLDNLSEDIDLKYLYYYLKGFDFKDIITGTAIPQITIEGLKKVVVAIPTMQEQQEIIGVFDKISSIISDYQQKLEKLDNLIKARFVELFGDPVSNTKGWDKVALDDCVESIDNGKSLICDSFARIDEKPAILKLSAATYGVYKPDENKAIIDENDFVESAEVCAGDLLFTRKNTPELVGMAAYVYSTPKKLMMPDLIFRINTKQNCRKIYLWKLINHDLFRGQIQSLAGGSAKSMSNISKERLGKLQICLPPLELQIQFEKFVEQTDKSKVIDINIILKGGVYNGNEFFVS